MFTKKSNVLTLALFALVVVLVLAACAKATPMRSAEIVVDATFSPAEGGRMAWEMDYSQTDSSIAPGRLGIEFASRARSRDTKDLDGDMHSINVQSSPNYRSGTFSQPLGEKESITDGENMMFYLLLDGKQCGEGIPMSKATIVDGQYHLQFTCTTTVPVHDVSAE